MFGVTEILMSDVERWIQEGGKLFLQNGGEYEKIIFFTEYLDVKAEKMSNGKIFLPKWEIF